ncbi:helix-turn-helix domain-containing protein [Methanospirillum hungatei]|uniref:AlbA family DNA-binding domain-containing protein n=1 Tax=Methanospirillum hungatei TaxID=2203 RepID=UPI0026EB5247|nr:RNA-binding domain-containing protein [Methanospirillum hungatei]MCA1917728.1 putative DNA binding domain-containing protein [Methanospirillum hungatei]
MNRSDLSILLQEGEGSMLEYKESLSSALSRELVAFANTAGGKILLGVRDDGSVKGITDTNDIRARIQDIARNCDPPVKILITHIDNVTIITVRESSEKPVQCSDGFFWRQGAVTQKLTREEIWTFFQKEGAIRFDLSISPKFRYPEDLTQINSGPGFPRVGYHRLGTGKISSSISRQPNGQAENSSSGMPASSSLQKNPGDSSTRHTSPVSSFREQQMSVSLTGRTSPAVRLPISKTVSASSSGIPGFRTGLRA